MHTESIRDAVRERPFKPFTLRLNDGREYFIPHPEYVAVSKREVIVIHSETERSTHLEPILIASMEFGEKKAKKGKNGEA